MRKNGRDKDTLRAVAIEPDYIKHAEGSVLITVGDTKVICTATIEDRVPPFMRGQGKGWITAEYSMLPRATESRNQREASRGKLGGRTMEIQRLIGRSLRSVVQLDKIGERTIWLDCDVIQADGGTRTASITGAYISMVMALGQLLEEKKLTTLPVKDFLAATSVGVLDNDVLLDLCYEEDSQATVDMNVVMTGQKEFVEIQGTGEEHPYTRDQMNHMLDYAEKGIAELIEKQKDVLGPLAEKVSVDSAVTENES
ncbi:ribonuclease PH [Caldalkalibacillus salinus]|uniref:ribonuclease PH n=1 Tax=Caldalkalibacillus salinus TaxID=2803787 RepID=UPI001920718A